MAKIRTYIRHLYENCDLECVGIGSMAFASFVALTLFLAVTGHKFVSGDADHYWHMSSRLDSMFDPLFLPGYPATIFVIRQFTGGFLSGDAILLGVSCLSFVISCVLLFRILKIFNPSDAFVASLLFMFFPFVGVAVVVDPRADAMAFMLLLASLLMIVRDRAWGFCLLGALALLTHKALWPSIFLIALIALLKGDLKWYHVVVLALPVGALFVSGALYYQDIVWMFSDHMQVVAMPRGTWSLFDGIIGTVQAGAWDDVVKAFMVVSLLSLSLFLSYQAVRSRNYYMVAILVPIVFWSAVLNTYEIWASMRFGKIVVLPLFVLPSFLLRKWHLLKSNRIIVFLLILLLVASQVAFVWRIKIRVEMWFGHVDTLNPGIQSICRIGLGNL